MRFDIFRIDSSADIQVHKAGCADAVKLRRKHGHKVDFVVDVDTDWTSKEAFGAFWWDDINAEQDGGQPYTWQDDGIVWKPCTNELQDWESTEMTETLGTEPTTAPETKPLPGKAPNEVPAPRSPKSKALPDGTCRCGCKKPVGRTSTFAQGHDARHVSNLVADVTKGKRTREDVIAEAASISEPLKAKLVKNLDNVAAQATKSQEAAAAKEKKAQERAKAQEEAKRLKDEAAKAKAAEPVVPADETEPDVKVENEDLDATEGADEDDDF